MEHCQHQQKQAIHLLVGTHLVMAEIKSQVRQQLLLQQLKHFMLTGLQTLTHLLQMQMVV